MTRRVQESTETIASFDGTRLALHTWEPAQGTAGELVALIHHGAAYHGGAYSQLGRFLAAAGIPALALDARGHGLSEGERGDLDRARTLLRDLEVVSAAWRGRHPEKRLLLIGESMGGLVALLYAARAKDTPAQADALVLSAPGILIHPEQVFNRDTLLALPRSLLQWNGGGIARPAERITPENQQIALPRDEVEELALRSFSANYMMIIAGMSIHSPVAAIQINVPTLIVHGKKDDVVPYQGSRLLFYMLATRDKELSLYPDEGHTLFWNDPTAPVYADLISWLSKRFRPAA